MVSGQQSEGITRYILAEIEWMIQDYQFKTYEHYRALVWFRDRLREKL